MSSFVFDTHALVVSQDRARYPHSPLGGTASAWSAERSVTAEQYLAAADDSGIARAVLLQSSTTYGFNNDYLADVVAAHRDRLCGMFSVNILEDDAPERMRHWYARGLRGMRIFTHGSTMKEAWVSVDDPKAQPAWVCAEDLAIPVATNANNLAEVGNVLRRHPRLSLILEHVTRPQIKDGPPYDGIGDLLDLSRHDNVFLKITPRTLAVAREGKASPETYLEKLIGAFGSERILWGSYFPPTPASLADIVADMRSVLRPFAQRDQDNIFGLTAKTLFS